MLEKSLRNALAYRIHQDFPRLGGERIRQLCADMIIDVFAMESVTARVQEQLRLRPDDDAAAELDMCYIFVASANQRVAGLASRLLANESDGEELARHLATLHEFTPFIPIRTIDTKARLAKRLVADQGWRFS